MLLKFHHVVYAVAIAIIFYTASATNAQALDTQVTIVNDTSNNHCRPSLSCYTPFQVNIAAGDTITWINQDNKTHTATTGTSNYGPQGVFDSGIIQPGKSFTQFFGTVGRYSYYDKTDMWPSGVIVVSKEFSHAELSWVPNSLKIEKQNYTSNGIVITKQIQNTGNADASSIIFTLKIANNSSLFYNGLVKLDVPEKQSVPVTFTWSNPVNGQYQLFFDANSANTAGDMNANDDRSLDLISIPQSTPVQNQSLPITHQNFTINDNTVSVPEFSHMSYFIFVASLVSILALSKFSLNAKLFS